MWSQHINRVNYEELEVPRVRRFLDRKRREKERSSSELQIEHHTYPPIKLHLKRRSVRSICKKQGIGSKQI